MRNAITFERPIRGHDPRRTANLECHIYATNVAAGLFRERDAYNVVFLQNNSNIPFITGDQPVINMLDPTKFDDLELYYPLGPKLAILLTKAHERFPNRKHVTGTFEVEHYNYVIYSKSDDQIYSDNEAYLRSLVSTEKGLLAI